MNKGTKSKLKKIILGLTAAVLAVVVALVLYVELHGVFDKRTTAHLANASDNIFISTDGTDTVAHRIGAGIFPEDTLLAAERLIFERAQGFYSADVIEADLRLTKDGELILLHDETLDRTTDSEYVFGVENAKPGDYTLAELEKLNFGAGFMDEDGNYPYRELHGDDVPKDLRVLTLRGLIEFLESKMEFKYILEVKGSGEVGIKGMDELVSVALEYGIEDRVLFASFHEEVLHHIDECYPTLHRHASTGEVAEFLLDFLTNKPIDECDYPYDMLDITPRYGPIYEGEGIGQKYGLLNLMSQGFINRAHECGIAVYYWTVNDETLIKRLVERGADGIITDYPSLVK